MQVEVTLTFTDETGSPRVVAVSTRHFLIGRNPDNNLQIADSNLSRQHALIECFDSFVQVTDCGSQNGTNINGTPVFGAVEIKHGDVITLGGAFDLKVSVREAALPAATPLSAAPAAATAATAQADKAADGATASSAFPVNAPPSWWLSVPVLAAAAAAIFVILGATVIFIVFSGDGRRPRKDRPGKRQESRQPLEDSVNENEVAELLTPSAPANTEDTNNTSTTNTPQPVSARNSPASEQIEKAAEQVMRRISTDSKDYSFSEKTVRDLRQKIELYRGSASTVREAIVTLQKGGPAIGAAARNEGIGQPYFILYAALAETDGGRSGRDAAATARAMLPDLVALRATLGDDQDSSLLVIAAYPEGTGTKKSHPLLGRMRRITNRDPVAKRNVWYLRENGGINEQAYDLVIRFIALGVIAQNPKQFGVNAEPLAF